MSLTFERLTLENFGPYRGRQEIRFDSAAGVWIFYGPNGRGKTKLHNAFRFAMYGEIRGRVGFDQPAKLCNRPNAESDGYKSMAVELEFSYDEHSYRIRRSFDDRETERPLKLSLEMDGSVLSRQGAIRTVEGIFPSAMAQFFLLDAEDLKPYENLTEEASEEGRRLRDAIESLLGIPLLKAAAAGVEVVRKEAQKKIEVQARADKAMEHFASSLRDASAIRDQLQSQLENENEALVHKREEFDSVERTLSENEVAEKAYGELEIAREEMRRGAEALSRATSDLSTTLSGVWSSVLSSKARKRRTSDSEQLRARQKDLAAIRTASETLEHFVDAKTCPTCGHELNEREIHDLRHSSKTKLADVGGTERQVSEDLGSLMNSIDVMNSVLDLDKSDLLRDRERLVSEQTLTVETARLREQAASEVLERFVEIDIKELTRRRSNLKHQIDNIVDRVGELGEKILEQTTAIEKLRKEMKQMGFEPDRDAERAEVVSGRLSLLFTRAATAYRDEIKSRVEADASDIFRAIASEPDYQGLKINDQFGLAILNMSGLPVEGRSAGYEHLVALALIAALQKNAPVQGPVVMDNPFLRLDKTHTRNVVSALPQVSNQMLLLTFPGEFDRAEALEVLKDDLVAEYHLERIEAEETAIVRGAPSGF